MIKNDTIPLNWINSLMQPLTGNPEYAKYMENLALMKARADETKNQTKE